MNEPKPIPPATPPSLRTQSAKLRRKRYIRYAVLLFFCVLLIPAIFIPPWLATKGIEIKAISGISFHQGLVIKEVSLSISKTTLTLHNITLGRYVDAESAISPSSWRLFAEKTQITPAPLVESFLNKQGIRLQHIDLTNTALNFTDWSAPYIFSAHAKKIAVSAFHHDNKQKQIQQEINNVDLILATKPVLTITGFIKQGDLTLFLPNLTSSPHYPLNFSKANFSIAWHPDATPLSVHIEQLNPQWLTLNNGFKQQLSNISLQMDIEQPANSIELLADKVILDQPVSLPAFVDKPDTEHQGLHLGKVIANLATLPFQVLRVKEFSYGELIIDSTLVLETPSQQPGKSTTLAKLTLAGKALGPEPYDMNFQIKHVNDQQARFSVVISGPDGNALECQAEIRFHHPLPKTMTCKANFRSTKELTDRLKLYGLPSALLSEPIIITAHQIEGPEKKQIVDNKEDNKLVNASYQLAIQLPSTIAIDLNRYSLPAHLLYVVPPEHDIKTEKQSAQSKKIAQPQKKTVISDIKLETDGQLNLTAHYQNNQLQLTLTDRNEKLSLKNKEINTQLSFLINQLTCTDRALHCHIIAGINGTTKQLYPSKATEINHVTFSSDIILQWSAITLTNTALAENTLLLENIKINAANLLFSGHSDLHTGQASKLNLAIDALTLQQSSSQPAGQYILSQPQDSQAHFSADFSAEKIISDSQQTSPPGKKSLNSKSQLPVQKYNGKLELDLSKFTLEKPVDTNLRIKTDYLTTLHIKQNNQRLPSFSSQGNIDLTPASVTLTGQLTNGNNARLLQFTIDSDFDQQKTHVKLHRNEIRFSNKHSLKKYYLPHLPINYDLYKGSMSLKANIILDKSDLSGDFALFTERLSGYFEGFRFADVNLSITSMFTPQGIQSKYPISLHIGLLHFGTLFENITAAFEFDSRHERYQLNRAFAQVFGGNISAQQVSSRSLTNIENIPITVHGIDLRQIIKNIEYEGIELTGILDGSLPLAVQDGLPVIRNGLLRSRYPGGLLRYLEGSAIDQNIEAAGENSILVVSKILKNYHYDSLAVDIDYSKEGRLKASSRFKGHNPEFQSGRPVYLNLNIEDDIPALIKTMNAINSPKLEGLFLKQLGLDE
ncbi:YdbH domain-containing protein [Photobacterium sp.]|uniref:YdbH domain-containing protein n=1 Tax=Photobacterium sp. TaxID=660 RepID=UPI00299CFF44|nr:YdbH domain-containing protein [Photobacterium sp.]MDX1302796.1 YdbH domain-containing protein [Photobacterium sp.]